MGCIAGGGGESVDANAVGECGHLCILVHLKTFRRRDSDGQQFPNRPSKITQILKRVNPQYFPIHLCGLDCHESPVHDGLLYVELVQRKTRIYFEALPHIA